MSRFAAFRQPARPEFSIVSDWEEELGAAKNWHLKRNHGALEQVRLPWEILDYGAATAFHYGEIHARQERVGEGRDFN